MTSFRTAGYISDNQDEEVNRTAEELKPLLRATDTKHALARYALGQRVNELESKYGEHSIEKLAKALGRGYGPDNLRMFARIARRWRKAAFESLTEQGLDISDFRELAKLSDDALRARVEQQAIENAWPTGMIRKEVRNAVGTRKSSARMKQEEQLPQGIGELTVTTALDALIAMGQTRVNEQARLRVQLDHIEPQAAQSLAAQIDQAIEAVRAQRLALQETEQLLMTALRLRSDAAA